MGVEDHFGTGADDREPLRNADDGRHLLVGDYEWLIRAGNMKTYCF
jgi:hypothetical protein